MNPVNVQVLGIEEMRHRMRRLTNGVQTRVINTSLGAGLSKGRAPVRNQVPGQLKSIRAMVWSGVRKERSGAAKGVAVGKLGFAARLPRGRRAKITAEVAATHAQGFIGPQQPGSNKEPGMGMTPNNVHWWLLGTKKRYHRSSSKKNKRTEKMTILHSTGAMPKAPGDPLQTGVNAGQAAMFGEMKRKFFERLIVETKRAKAKQ